MDNNLNSSVDTCTGEKNALRTDSEKKHKKESKRVFFWIVLHAMLALYSLGSVCSKMAAGEKFLSFRFCMFYGIFLMILGVYAIGWQQIIKRFSLTVAYANKAISIFWTCVYGFVFFGEQITVGKAVGCSVVAVGVVLFAMADCDKMRNETC